MVMFVRDSYSVGEADGSLSYGLVASGNASFDYQVVISGEVGSAICEYIIVVRFIFLWAPQYHYNVQYTLCTSLF